MLAAVGDSNSPALAVQTCQYGRRGGCSLCQLQCRLPLVGALRQRCGECIVQQCIRRQQPAGVQSLWSQHHDNVQRFPSTGSQQGHVCIE